MSIPARQEAVPPPRPEDEIFNLFQYDVLQQHLHDLQTLNYDALIGTLVPNRALPQWDPASYIMNRRTQDTAAGVELKDGYDLGVVFGRSLLLKALPEGRDLPVVTDFDEVRRAAVDLYLDESSKLPLTTLVRRDNRTATHVNRAVQMFANRCEVVAMDLMMPGPEPVIRGFYDFLNTVVILEAPEGTSTNAANYILSRLKLGQRLMQDQE